MLGSGCHGVFSPGAILTLQQFIPSYDIFANILLGLFYFFVAALMMQPSPVEGLEGVCAQVKKRYTLLRWTCGEP